MEPVPEFSQSLWADQGWIGSPEGGGRDGYGGLDTPPYLENVRGSVFCVLCSVAGERAG